MISNNDKCLTAPSIEHNDVHLSKCNVDNQQQRWIYDTEHQTIKLQSSNQCLSAPTEPHLVNPKSILCNRSKAQKWEFIEEVDYDYTE